MLQIPVWKRVLILGLVAIGLLFAMPNLFYERVERHNDAVAEVERAGFETPEQAAARAGWPDWLPSNLVNLGLDLRGGAHLLGEVHVADVYRSRMNALWPDLREALARERDVIGAVRRAPGPPDQLHVEIGEPSQMARAVEIARGLATPVASLSGAGSSDLAITASGSTLVVGLSEAERAATDDRTIQQSLEIVRRRVDEVGTREPTIQRQGADRILIQVPGIGSAEELKALIGTTARLTFHPVVGQGTDANARPGPGNIIVPSLEQPGVFYTLTEAPVVSGEELTDARPSFDQNGQPAVEFRFNPTGARRFGAYTAANVGQLFAIVLDNQVISAPVIRDAIPGGQGQISGAMTVDESNRLAVLLRAGALPAQMTFLEERTIGPELGQDSINAGALATVVATVLVVGYIVASYGLFGVFASIAVIVNVILILSVMSMIGAITAALWMGGAPDGAVDRLKQFWNAAADKAVWGAASIWRRNAVVRALLYGRPALFHASFPGMLAAMPGVPPDDHVFDTAPMRRLLLGLIDFDALNASACRITISAMDQTTAEVLRFDNRTGHLTVDHVLASASIPVAFPPVMLEGRPLIDAGLGDNCPALALLDRPIERPTCAWIADLWPAEAERAGSLDLILRRSQDIAFAAQRLRSVGELRKRLAERSGEPPPVTLTEIVHDGAGYEIGGKAFDFTQAALARRWAAGHEQTRRALDSVA